MENALIPVADLEKMATVMGKSGLFGKSPDQILSLMLIAQAEGLHPATVAQEYDVIQGRPALKSQAALARFQRSGGSIEWLTRNDEKAEAKFSHPQGGTITVCWDLKKAERMGLAGKDNWKKQPGIMLQWRTVAEGVRACFPACLGQLYLAEEVQDFEPRKMRNVTPVSEPTADFEDEKAPPAPFAADIMANGAELTEKDKLRADLKAYLDRMPAVVKTPSGVDVKAQLRAVIENADATEKDLSAWVDRCTLYFQAQGEAATA